mmetsp:Transcript_71414/g.187223  ORF Transcript_71414/g.187223 Transcript_71414/m.187223 type:complete len:205 (+) Transcript_71414:537-1151(+)
MEPLAAPLLLPPVERAAVALARRVRIVNVLAVAALGVAAWEEHTAGADGAVAQVPLRKALPLVQVGTGEAHDALACALPHPALEDVVHPMGRHFGKEVLQGRPLPLRALADDAEGVRRPSAHLRVGVLQARPQQPGVEAVVLPEFATEAKSLHRGLLLDPGQSSCRLGPRCALNPADGHAGGGADAGVVVQEAAHQHVAVQQRH